MSDALVPSGLQVDLRLGNQTATIVEVGGGIRTYAVAGVDTVEGYAIDEMCSAGRGQILMPWPNRIDGGIYEFDGAAQHLPLSEAARGNAIHGLTRSTNWTVAEQGPSHAVMTHRLAPQPGYPWCLDLRVAYQLDSAGLRVTMSATNRSSSRCPFGCGVHPYLTLGTGRIDGLVLRSPARRIQTANERLIPTGSAELDGGPDDFRAPRAIGATQFDTCFTDMERGPDGRATVTLTSGDRRVDLWMDETFDYLMVFTGDSLAPDKRRTGIAIEPMTCAPNAFRSGEGLIVLEPGQTYRGQWGITPAGFG